ncbi:MAG: hypothetical protein ABW215_08365 [Kibdelosporangium sp.]
MAKNDAVKWTRAVQHLQGLAGECARMAGMPGSISPLRVVGLWTFGEILADPTDLDGVNAVVVADVDAVPWLSRPHGAEHWANASRMSRNPVTAFWRSSRTPVWNHLIERPLLLWDAAEGVRAEAFAALLAGTGDTVRTEGPSPAELDQRIDEELSLSLEALRERVDLYEEKRWSPGKLTPISDQLWEVGKGYLDLLDARAGRAT